LGGPYPTWLVEQDKARAMLLSILGRFAEGFESADLIAGAALVEELDA